jgi:hypothetical protein
MNTPSLDDKVAALGSPTCGLVGPFAFPFQWTSQRDQGGRKSSRKAMHRLTGINGAPLFIEAAPPPIKQLKNMLREFGTHVCLHQYEIGEELFFLFVETSTVLVEPVEIILDLTQILEKRACPRYDTWKLINDQRRWFYKLFSESQQRAIANGRYFPPPNILRVRIHRANGVRIEIGFSEGFFPGNKLLVVNIPVGGAGAVSTSYRPKIGVLAHADESIPAGQSLNEQVEHWATAFSRVDERILFAGFIRDLSHYDLHHVWHALTEGDELAVRIEEGKIFTNLYLVWRGRTLGKVAHGDVKLALRHMREAKPLRFAIVRLHAFHESSFGQIAYAMYGA